MYYPVPSESCLSEGTKALRFHTPYMRTIQLHERVKNEEGLNVQFHKSASMLLHRNKYLVLQKTICHNIILLKDQSG